MEKLKSWVPDNLKRMVAESTTDDLPSASSTLLQFFLHLALFQDVVMELVGPEKALCGKNKDCALQLKKEGNSFFSSGDYPKALSYYSQALRVAPIDADDMDKNLVAMLHVNRASVLYKMGLLMECLRDCSLALQISSRYAKAWYRRGKVNALLGNYEEAILDLNVAKTVELSLVGKRQIENELKMLNQSKRTNCSLVQHNGNKLSSLDEPHQNKVQCVSTLNKGRGMASLSDIPESSLLHAEEPFAAIILKHCRETHCHYCFNELPADIVPCTSCSIPLYCSRDCQVQAGGQRCRTYPTNYGTREKLSTELEKHIAEITLHSDSDLRIQNIPEHKHECQGVHWPAILPSDVVLAGRIIVKSIAENRCSTHISNLAETLELSHSYTQMPPESKLEAHIYSIVLLCCLRQSDGFELPTNGVSISQIVILISQIRVNSMAIVRMKSTDVSGIVEGEGALTSNVEQVRVGQAIYRAGSLFNHSCQPNVHAYFLGRTLFIRATEFVAAGCPLELSYGPQVGQSDQNDRLKFLEDVYSFECQCSGCSEVNLSDLVLNSFHCVSPDCAGVVLNSNVNNCKKQEVKFFHSIPNIRSLEPHLQVDKLGNKEINTIAPGYCLKCGSYRDPESSRAAVDRAWIYIRRLQDAIDSKEILKAMLPDASRFFCLLRSTLHAYNKAIAEAEDILAQAWCLVGELQPAIDHCKASIEILGKLYGLKHIVIGYELLKFSSIQLYLGDPTAVDSIKRLREIFSCHYGSHADMMFPYLQSLEREARQFSQ